MSESRVCQTAFHAHTEASSQSTATALEGLVREPHAIDKLGNEHDAQLDRLTWRCRRGLLELDLWLGGFLAASRATLQPDEMAAFERLLAMSDMHILDLLQNARPADNATMRAFVVRLQNYRAP